MGSKSKSYERFSKCGCESVISSLSTENIKDRNAKPQKSDHDIQRDKI